MKFSCPKCNDEMIMILFNGEYQAHGCKKCKLFYELENIKDFT